MNLLLFTKSSRTVRWLLSSLWLVLLPLLGWGQYTPGNLVVERANDGTSTLANTATPVFLDEYTPAGTLQAGSVALNATGTANKLTISGTSTAEGQLTLSGDGRYLVLAGYNAVTGASNPSAVVSTTNPRTVAVVSSSKAIDLTTALTDAYSANNIRSATSVDGNVLFTGGNGTTTTGGIRYATVGSTASTYVSGTLNNVRVVQIFGGNIYFTTATGVFRLGATTTTTSQTPTALGATGNGSPYGFVFFDRSPTVAGVDLLYVADDTGGIYKYSYDGTTWTARGRVITTNVRGLTGTINAAGNIVLYATTTAATANTLITATDLAAYNATATTATATTLATAAANTAFRGVAFAPAPTPAITSFSPTVGPVGTSVTINGSGFYNGNIPLAVSFNGVAATTFSIVSTTQITATVPTGATTGQISITTQGGTATTSGLTPAVYTVGAANSPTVIASPNSLSSFSAAVGTPSVAQNYTLTGSNLTADVTVTPPAGYEVSQTSATTGFAGDATTITVTQNSGNVSTTIYVRLTGAAVGTSSGNVTNVSTTGSANVAVSGAVITPALTVSPASLSGFTYVAGSGPSGIQNYVLSNTAVAGSTGTITTTAPTDYELSTSATFATTSANPLLTSYTGTGAAQTYTIYVRLKAGLTANTYNETITNTNGGLSAPVTVAGTVTPPPALTATPNALSGFSTTTSTPSTPQTYVLTGTNVVAATTVTPPAGYAVSLDGTTYSTTNVSAPASTVNTTAGQTIYVRLTGTTAGTFSGNITNISGSASTSVMVSGTTAGPPTVTVSTAALAAFNTLVGAPSAIQNYTVSGSNLTADIIISAPAGYEVSLTTGTAGFASSQTVAQTSGTVATTTVYVRLTGATAGTPGGNVTNVSGSASANKAVTGTVVAEPTTAPTVAATTVGSTTATLTVGSGNGARRLLIVRAATTAAVAPIDQTTYTANLAFANTATGTTTGAGNYIVLNGTGTSAAVTGLSTTTNYVAEVYAYNQSSTTAGFENYLLTPLGTVSFTTAAAPPFLEDFENDTKTGFAIGTVSLRTGSWTFDNSLIGTNTASPADLTRDMQSARLRNAVGSTFYMNFDKPNGAGVISLYAGNYNSGAGGSFTLDVSTDAGTTWTAFSATQSTLTNSLVQYSFTVNITGPIRIRVRNPVAVRSNIDDISITDFTVAAPEIDITQGTTPIASGGSYAFANTVTSSSTNSTFTIANTGSANLTISSIALSNNANGAFSIVTSPLPTSVPATAGSNTTPLVIQFAPTTAGPQTATLTILNNDADEGTYTITLNGNGLAPEPVAPQPTATVANVTASTVDVSVAGGTGAKRLVVVRPAASAAVAPADAATYVASLVYGTTAVSGRTGTNNYVVIAGTTTGPVTITGLAGSTAYVVEVYAYNDNGVAGAENYLTSTPGSAAFTTLVPPVSALQAGMLLLEDDINYPNGALLKNNGWTVHSAGTNPISVETGNLAFTQFPLGTAGSSSNQATSIGTEDINRSFTYQNVPTGSNTLYLAAVVKIGLDYDGYFLHFMDNNLSTAANPIFRGALFTKSDGSGSSNGRFAFGFSAAVTASTSTSATAYTSYTYTTGQNYLVIVKYVTNPGGIDEASLFVLDAAAPLVEPTPTIGPLTTTNSIAARSLNAVALRQDNTTPIFNIDGIRVATGWGSAIGKPSITGVSANINAGNYYNLTLNNGSTLTPSGAVNIEGNLALVNGNVNTSATNSLTLYQGAAFTGGSATSFVSGPLSRVTGSGAATTTFPIGKGTAYRPLTLNTTAQSEPRTYTAEQFNNSANTTAITGAGSGTTSAADALRRVSDVRYFTLAPTTPSGSFSGTVTLTFDTDDAVNNPGDASLVIAKRADNNSAWGNFGRSAYTGTANGNAPVAGTLTSDVFTSFSDFALASTDPTTSNNPLPVSLTRFTATRAAVGVQVAWATASEKNSDYFEVQRSLDGSNFTSVAKVAAQGTTTQSHTYASLDGTAPAALLYYRLRQVDLDGTVAYSPVVSVAADGTTSEFTLAPNPAHDRVSFLTALPTAYTVRNTLGQLVRSGTTEAGTNNLPVAELPAGVYFFELHGGAGRVVRKFVKE